MCSKSCLELCLKIFAGVVLIMGLIGAIVAGVALGGYGDYLPAELQNYLTATLIAICVFSVFLIIVALCGLVGACYPSKLSILLTIFKIAAGLFAFIFLILAIVLFVSVFLIPDISKKDICQKDSVFGAWDKLEKVGFSTVCTKSCKCELEKDSDVIDNLSTGDVEDRLASFTYTGVDAQAESTSESTGSNSTETVSFLKISSDVKTISFTGGEQTNSTADNSTGGEQTNSITDNSTDNQAPVVEEAPSKHKFARFQQCDQYKEITKSKNVILEETADGSKVTKIAEDEANKSDEANKKGIDGTEASGPFKYTFSKVSTVSAITIWGSMGLIESNLKCAGICEQRPFYVFSDVNNGVPEEACGAKMKELLNTYGLRAAIVSLVIFFVLVVVIIIAICLKSKREEELKEGQN